MYSLCTIQDNVRVPPAKFSEDLNKTILEITRKDYEGFVDSDLGVVIAVVEAEKVGDGRIVPGDGAAFYSAKLTLLTYKPTVQELIEGHVAETTDFGAFVRIGPIDGLVHVSQIMDDYIDYDAKTQTFAGKESKRQLKANDNVLARIVTVSLKGSVAESKIGLTMRQPYLGKKEWAKMRAEKAAKAPAEKKPKTEKQKE